MGEDEAVRGAGVEFDIAQLVGLRVRPQQGQDRTGEFGAHDADPGAEVEPDPVAGEQAVQRGVETAARRPHEQRLAEPIAEIDDAAGQEPVHLQGAVVLHRQRAAAADIAEELQQAAGRHDPAIVEQVGGVHRADGRSGGHRGQGFGADLLQRQQALEQQRMQFGTGLFGAGSGLYGQYNANVTGALQPYSNYAAQAYGLEQQGMGPLEMSAALGGRAMQGGAYAGKYGLEGATAAAASQQKADRFSPFGDFLSGAGSDPVLKDALSRYYRGGASQAGPVSMPGYGGMYDTATYVGR